MRTHLFNALSSFLQILLIIHAFYPIATAAQSPSAVSVTTSVSAACPLEDPTTYHIAREPARLPKVYDTLVACPGIKDLDLTVQGTGCVIGPEPDAFNFRAGDRFPTLRNLTIRGYDFHSDGLPPVPHPQKAFDWQGYLGLGWRQTRIAVGAEPVHVPSLDKWLQAMDWTQLERLSIDTSDTSPFWARMATELPGLRHFKTRTYRFSADLAGFLTRVPPLESLAVHSVVAVTDSNATLSCAALHLDALLLRHGSSLRDLRLSQDESYTPGRRRIACNATEIAHIYDQCPQLTHLTLDLDRNGTWPDAELDALTTSPSLQTLHLRLEMGANLHSDDYSGSYGWNRDGLHAGGPFRQPALNNTAAAETLFRRLREKKVGHPLQRLELEVGDFDTPAWDGPIYIPHWAEGRARKFVCEADRVSEDGTAGTAERTAATDVMSDTRTTPSRGTGYRGQRTVDAAQPVCEMLGTHDPWDWEDLYTYEFNIA